MGLGETFTWYFNDQLLPVTEATISNAQSGVYRVVVNTFNGCVATDTYALPTTANFLVQIMRTEPEVTPAIIEGVMSGGNGPDYTVMTSPADIIVDVNVHNAVPPQVYSGFTISEVPPAATLLIDVCDSGSCCIRVVSEGTGTPIPPIVPSPSPAPEVVPYRSFDVQITVIAATIGSLVCFLMFVSIGAEMDRRRREALREEKSKRI